MITLARAHQALVILHRKDGEHEEHDQQHQAHVRHAGDRREDRVHEHLQPRCALNHTQRPERAQRPDDLERRHRDAACRDVAIRNQHVDVRDDHHDKVKLIPRVAEVRTLQAEEARGGDLDQHLKVEEDGQDHVHRVHETDQVRVRVLQRRLEREEYRGDHDEHQDRVVEGRVLRQQRCCDANRRILRKETHRFSLGQREERFTVVVLLAVGEGQVLKLGILREHVRVKVEAKIVELLGETARREPAHHERGGHAAHGKWRLLVWGHRLERLDLGLLVFRGGRLDLVPLLLLLILFLLLIALLPALHALLQVVEE
mmetsp:Transcript_6682/g.13685  ORF Transcript_6682/g.13685 Transcript_6682/m.13685 type:complete len:315 (-) Transcript_6682:2694-3638(-)